MKSFGNFSKKYLRSDLVAITTELMFQPELLARLRGTLHVFQKHFITEFFKKTSRSGKTLKIYIILGEEKKLQKGEKHNKNIVKNIAWRRLKVLSIDSCRNFRMK